MFGEGNNSLLSALHDPVENLDNRRISGYGKSCKYCGTYNSVKLKAPIRKSKLYTMDLRCKECDEPLMGERSRLRRGWIYDKMAPNFDRGKNYPVPQHLLPPDLKGKKVWNGQK